MDNLGVIRLFVEAAVLGSLSAAGRKLDLSPAAASACLVRLEAALGVQLFERTTRSLRLTDERRTYLTHCQHALQTLDDAHAALQAKREIVSGKLRVSATSDFGRNMLRHWLDAFNERDPDVSIALILSDSLSQLLQDDIDLAIRFGVTADSTMIAKPMAPNRHALCASPEYLDAHGTPTEFASLARHRFVLMSLSAGLTNEWRFECNGDVTTFAAPVAGSRETNDGAIAREWALEGRGIAMKLIWNIGADLETGRLRLVLPVWRCPELPVHALFQRRQFMAPRIRSLLDFLA